MIIIDITSKTNWILHFDCARVNENASNHQAYDATKDIALGQVHSLEKEQTPNVQHPTLNRRIRLLHLALSVERFVHLLLFHSSQPPCKTKMLFSPASSRSRRATSAAALQLCALQ